MGEAAFYAYAYPEPDGYSEYNVVPDEAYYHKELGEYILPHDTVRTANDPDSVLSNFLQSTYLASANLAGWDRRALERQTPP